MIVGAPTSITAFVGSAPRGPLDGPVPIASFADYERRFGGLADDSTMSFAVQQYFQSGGNVALIVRLHNGAVIGKGSLPLVDGGAARLRAANPGGWSANLRVRIDWQVEPAILSANPPNTMFNLRVKDLASGLLETHTSVSIRPRHRRFVSTVLANESTLLRGPARLTALPAASDAPTTAGDPFADVSSIAIKVRSRLPDGKALTAAQLYAGANTRARHRGLYQLDKADIVNLLVVPPYSATTDLAPADRDALAAYAGERRAIALIDAPSAWDRFEAVPAPRAIADLMSPNENAALYFPRITMSNPLHGNASESFAPTGAVAGVIARSDTTRGVWHAPAGVAATLTGALGLSVQIPSAAIDTLAPLGVNALRNLPSTGIPDTGIPDANIVIWGARTLASDPQWRYLPVRRLALYVEQSVQRGIAWAAYQPNAEPLWAEIRLQVGAFLDQLFHQGALRGAHPQEAWFVRCDHTTMTQADIDAGRLIVVIGIAPLRPAEFVIISILQSLAHKPP